MADQEPKENQPTREVEAEALIQETAPKLYEEVPNDIRPQVRQIVSQVIERRIHSGPLPPAEELARYNEVLPGAAERIIAMAERQAAHRIGIESRVIDSQMRQSNRGQWLGFTIAIIFLAGSLIATLAGYPWVGGILGGATLVSLVTVFALGQQQQRRDLSEKRSRRRAGVE